MPDAVLETPVTPAPAPESLGWRAGLPDDLKTNEAFAQYKTVGEFAKTYLDTSAKAADLARKLESSVPKLSDNPTDAERAAFYDALGRPKQPSEYELEGEDKNASEWTKEWKQEFHSLGLTKSQAKALSAKFNGKIQAMVEAHNARVKSEIAEATAKFKSEQGDKFDTNVELAKRLWSKYGEGDFDKAFDAETSAARVPIMRMILKFAALTGEDRSPQGAQTGTGKPTGNPYPNSKMPPART